MTPQSAAGTRSSVSPDSRVPAYPTRWPDEVLIVRVNIEDDLWTTNRLNKLSRVIGWNERETLGALTMVYRRTQTAELATGTMQEIVNAVEIDFDSQQQARDFIGAMVIARLASMYEGGEIEIRGNRSQVERLSRLRANAKAGGKRRQADAKQMANDSLADSACSERSLLLTPGSDLRSPNTGILVQAPLKFAEASLNEHDSRGGSIPRSAPQNEFFAQDFGAVENFPEKVPAKKRNRSKRPMAEQEAARAVREAFHAAYSKRYQVPLTAWGAPENAHVYVLLKTWPQAELVAMARRYFEWARPEVIRAGHPFMKNAASFSAKLHELKADLVNPERRAQAADVAGQERQHDFRAELEAQGERVLRQLQEERNGSMGRVSTAADAEREALGRGSQLALRDPLAPDERRSAEALDQTPASAGGIGVVRRDG